MEHTLRGVCSYVMRMMLVASLSFTGDQYDAGGFARQRPAKRDGRGSTAACRGADAATPPRLFRLW